MQASAENCDECKSSFTFWSQVYELLTREGEYQPSSAVLRLVKDALPDNQSAPWWKKVTDFASVVFDSALTPALAGVRSGARSTRQITVESGAFVVDLQLESDTVQHRYSLTGQILENGDSTAKVDGAEIVLLSPDQVMQKTSANEMGEFCLDFQYGDNLRLFIDIRGERGVGIILPKLDDARTELTH
ncbi:MAG: hypothetical protein ACJ74Y_16695 [Bryobacteraceae bacterium]